MAPLQCECEQAFLSTLVPQCTVPAKKLAFEAALCRSMLLYERVTVQVGRKDHPVLITGFSFTSSSPFPYLKFCLNPPHFLSTVGMDAKTTTVLEYITVMFPWEFLGRNIMPRVSRTPLRLPTMYSKYAQKAKACIKHALRNAMQQTVFFGTIDNTASNMKGSKKGAKWRFLLSPSSR